VTVIQHSEVVYAVVPGYRPLALDLYVGEAPRAVCGFLHGGGWRIGSRLDGPGPVGPESRRFFEHMAERGLAVASIDYRLSSEAVFPAQLDDVVEACRFLAHDGSSFGLDRLPLALWGVSAGAHLAGLGALASDIGDTVAAVSMWSAPSDLIALADDLDAIGQTGDRGSESRESQLLGGVVSARLDLARVASPIAHVRPTATAFQVVHGTSDQHIPATQSERFAQALSEAGTSVTSVLVEGANHFYSTIDAARLAELVDASIDFLLDRSAPTG
jgi:acetyl esterase/lipase